MLIYQDMDSNTLFDVQSVIHKPTHTLCLPQLQNHNGIVTIPRDHCYFFPFVLTWLGFDAFTLSWDRAALLSEDSAFVAVSEDPSPIAGGGGLAFRSNSTKLQTPTVWDKNDHISEKNIQFNESTEWTLKQGIWMCPFQIKECSFHQARLLEPLLHFCVAKWAKS